MRVKVMNPNRVVSSAWSGQEDRNGCYSIIINFSSKSGYVGSTTSGLNKITFFCEQHDRDTLGNEDCVEVIAENDEDIKILSRIRFENHCKDQLWIVFLDESHY